MKNNNEYVKLMKKQLKKYDPQIKRRKDKIEIYEEKFKTADELKEYIKDHFKGPYDGFEMLDRMKPRQFDAFIYNPYINGVNDYPKQVIEYLKNTALEFMKYELYGSYARYEVDIWNAVAYHVYVRRLSDKNIKFIELGDSSFNEDYKNLPVDIYFKAEDDIVGKNTLPDIGKILQQINPEKGSDEVRKIFRRKDVFCQLEQRKIDKTTIEIDSFRYYSNIDLSRFFAKALAVLDKEKFTQADCWFWDNTINLDLMLYILENKRKNNYCEYETQLIWYVCKCIPPSVRMSILKHIWPLTEFVKSISGGIEQKEYFDSLFSELDKMINEINYHFTKMLNNAEYVVDRNMRIQKNLNLVSEGRKKSFINMIEEIKKFEDMPLNRLSYVIISSLNQRWDEAGKYNYKLRNRYLGVHVGYTEHSECIVKAY